MCHATRCETVDAGFPPLCFEIYDLTVASYRGADLPNPYYLFRGYQHDFVNNKWTIEANPQSSVPADSKTQIEPAAQNPGALSEIADGDDEIQPDDQRAAQQPVLESLSDGSDNPEDSNAVLRRIPIQWSG